MAKTNFAKLTTEQVTVWSRDVWKLARNRSFLNKFAGKSADSIVHRVTELTKNEKGARAVLTLVADIEGDGVAGDSQLENREEEIKAYDRVIRIDQMRNAHRSEGRMADQRSVVKFRETARDQLAYWLADRMDQLGFLTLAGIGYGYNVDGTARASSTFSQLDFAADVSAATSNRHFNWTASGFAAGDVTQASIAVPSWELIVEARAKAETTYMKPVRGEGGDSLYHVFMSPDAMAKLKMDSDYLAAARSALPRSKSANELWAGADTRVIDGIVLHTYRLVPNFTASSDFAGEGTAGVTGCTMLMCGSQALGMADLGVPYWDEEMFDYKNQKGISVGKICGFLKPKFKNIHTGQDDDFGVMRINVKSV